MKNSITLIGHVGKDPVAKNFDDTGNKLVKFTLAVKDCSSNSDEERTLWVDIDAWNGLADRVMQTVTKGREVAVFGKLAVNTYSKEIDGKNVQISKPMIKLSSFHLCGRLPRRQQEVDDDKQLTEAS